MENNEQIENNEISNKISDLIELLGGDKKILIPIYQRDYAQGRNSAEEIRNTFLEALKEGLKDGNGLHLDFVYGYEKDNCFIPMDGQQRLTTLFLLFWYLSHKFGKFEGLETYFIKGGTSKLTYETRTSSTDFFNKLMAFSPTKPQNSEEKISQQIMDQHWFFNTWMNDATISATLNMLDAIQKVFKGEDLGISGEELVKRFKKITFTYLEIDNNDADDNNYYVNLNARGLQLTPFEKFKPAFTKLAFFGKEGNDETKNDVFKKSLNTTWLEKVWKQLLEEENRKDEEKNKKKSDPQADTDQPVDYAAKVDDYMLRTIYASTACYLIAKGKVKTEAEEKKENKQEQEENKNQVKKANRDDIADLFDNSISFSKYKELFDYLSEDEKDELIDYITFYYNNLDFGYKLDFLDFNELDFDEFAKPPYSTEKGFYFDFHDTFFKQETMKNTALLYAYMSYKQKLCPRATDETKLNADTDETKLNADDKLKLDDWMRIISNILEDYTFGNVNSLIAAVGYIANIINSMGDTENALNYFANGDKKWDKDLKFTSYQAKEEERKAELIIGENGERWKKEIIAAERHSYFNRQIGFLLDFTEKALEDKTSTGNDHLTFKSYRINASKIFHVDKNSETITPWIRGQNLAKAVLAQGDYRLNYSFLRIERRDKPYYSWYNFLKDEDVTRGNKRDFLRQVLDKIDEIDNIDDIDDKLIGIRETCSTNNPIEHYPYSLTDAQRKYILAHPHHLSVVMENTFRVLRYDGTKKQICVIPDNGSSMANRIYYRELYTYIFFKKYFENNEVNNKDNMIEYESDATSAYIKFNDKLFVECRYDDDKKDFAFVIRENRDMGINDIVINKEPAEDGIIWIKDKPSEAEKQLKTYLNGKGITIEDDPSYAEEQLKTYLMNGKGIKIEDNPPLN